MLELVEFIVRKFAENQEKVFVEERAESEDNVTILVKVAPSDMGKVIGKQGKNAQAMRTLAKAMSGKDKKRYSIEIRELED